MATASYLRDTVTLAVHPRGWERTERVAQELRVEHLAATLRALHRLHELAMMQGELMRLAERHLKSN
jgi:hypothetical protein